VRRCIYVIKSFVYFALYMISRAISKEEVSILAYHSVDSNGSSYTVNPEEFRRQIEYLRKRYEIVSLDRILDFVSGKESLPGRLVAVTCDDGYYDNYLNIYPYLRKYGLPLTIFVTTGYVGKKMTLGNTSLKMLDWEEITRMSQDNVTIGAHTVSHPDLNDTDLGEARSQISSSKIELERRVGKPVNYFSYPFSRFNGPIVDMVRTLGFRAAVGGEGGLVHRDDNPYLLRRTNVGASTDFLMFKVRLSKAADWYKGIERIMKRLAGRLFFYRTVERIYRDPDKHCIQEVPSQ
jgi:peptidoglycan/xylan/chitin deacetylase (PgdA/CDA1 family)